MTDRYKDAYDHYKRQVEKRWPETVIAREWGEMGEEMQTCWRAGFERFAADEHAVDPVDPEHPSLGKLSPAALSTDDTEGEVTLRRVVGQDSTSPTAKGPER